VIIVGIWRRFPGRRSAFLTCRIPFTHPTTPQVLNARAPRLYCDSTHIIEGIKVNVEASDHLARNLRQVEFWPGKTAELDIATLAASAVRVKAVSSPFPLRCLDLYLNSELDDAFSRLLPRLRDSETETFTTIKNSILPTSHGEVLQIGDHVPQPPFAWRDADPFELGLSFTYNTNGFFRILMNLRQAGLVEESDVPRLLDDACLLIGALYRADGHSLIRNVNNNLNMYLIPKVIEHVVGKTRFDADLQELATTRSAVDQAIILAHRRRNLPTLTKMKISLGMGISFMEGRLRHGQLTHDGIDQVETCSHRFDESKLAIDHRPQFLEMISNAGRGRHFSLAVILDDAAESIDDLLWLQDLVQEYPFLRVHLLVNSRQVSINFSVHLMHQIWRAPVFHELTSRIGSQVLLTVIDFPLVSFQTNYLPRSASRLISEADVVYVKGANFFETCQLREKETFYAFVVYGAISRRYSGLNDFDGVFAHVPSGSIGYIHNAGGCPPITLKDIVALDRCTTPVRRIEGGGEVDHAN